jgi:hypothetical protein
MKPTIFLRVASAMTLIHAILHTIGGVFSKPDPGAAQTAFEAMQSNLFMVFGLVRSYAIFYRGLGLGATISMTIEAIVFWQLGTLAKTHARLIRPVVASFVVAYLALAVNSSFYFFQAPVVFEILIAACLAMAIFTAKPSPAV